jgi:hypothetical protein
MYADFSQETPSRYNLADSEDDVSLKSEKELMEKSIQNKLSLGIQQIIQRPRRNYSARPYREYVSRRSAEFETKPEQDSGFGWPLLNWFQKAEDNLCKETYHFQSQCSTIFKDFVDLFEDLTSDDRIGSDEGPVISVTFNNKGTRILAVLQDEEQMKMLGNSACIVHQYDIATRKLVFKEFYGGGADSFIKMLDIAQNKAGDMFCCPYIDDGNFRMRIFGESPRSEAQIVKSDIDINKALTLNNHTMVNEDFENPNITACFLNNFQLFVSLFHNGDMQHIQFIWDIDYRKTINVVKVPLAKLCSRQNFPMATFYDEKTFQAYTFYRQGQAFSADVRVSQLSQFDKKSHAKRKPTKQNYHLTEYVGSELGQMVLCKGRILVAQNSGSILFLKRCATDEAPIRVNDWYLYHTIHTRGFVSWHAATETLMVLSGEEVYFYSIEDSSGMPLLQNVMRNYFDATNMLISPDSQSCITYRLS